MKHGYGLENSETIKRYEVINNFIIITYLDKSTNKIEYTKENENKILNLMLKQAIIRNDLYLKQEKTNYLPVFSSIITAYLSFYSCTQIMQNDSNFEKFIYLYISGLTGISSIYLIKQFIQEHNIKQEIEKYAIYLEIKDCKVLNKFSFIDINTIDNYSLRDLKKIRKLMYYSGAKEYIYKK